MKTTINIYIIVCLLISVAGIAVAADYDYTNETSLRNVEIEFWNGELNNINDVDILYQIVDENNESLLLNGETDWTRNRHLDIVSRITFSRSFFATNIEDMFNLLQTVELEGIVYYNVLGVHNIIISAEGYMQGDSTTFGDPGASKTFGRLIYGYELGALRLYGGSEICHDFSDNEFGDDNYSFPYFEIAQSNYIAPIIYGNWSPFPDLVVNIGIPYSSVTFNITDRYLLGAVYDFRDNYTEASLRVHPFKGLMFVNARYIDEVRENYALDYGDFMDYYPYLGDGRYLDQDMTTYVFDLGYTVSVLVADVSLSVRGGYYSAGDAIFHDENGIELYRIAGGSGPSGGIGIVTEF